LRTRGGSYRAGAQADFRRRTGNGDLVERRIGGSILNDTITGVVADFKTRQLDADPRPEVYMPYQRFPLSRSMRVLVRTANPSGAIARRVQELLTQIDATQPAYEFETLEEALVNSIAPRRFQLLLLGVFAAAALLLAVILKFGVKLAILMQICPKNQHLPRRFMQQLIKFHKSSFSLPTVLAFELDARFSLPSWQ